MNDGGKGSVQRPQTVSHEQFAENFQQIFGLSKLEQRLRAERALEEMVRINQELGLYNDPQQ